MNRRRLLRNASVVLAGTIPGCSGTGPQTGTRSPTPTTAATDTPTSTSTPTPTTAATVTDRPTARPAVAQHVYVSEVRPNPEGPDPEALGEEYVLVETTAGTTRDLSGHTLAYGTRREYALPDLTSAVEPGANLELVSGRGTDRVDDASPPTYTLFVGSETPLLDNDGMRLTLRDAERRVVDTVEYGSVSEGGLYVRPET